MSHPVAGAADGGACYCPQASRAGESGLRIRGRSGMRRGAEAAWIGLCLAACSPAPTSPPPDPTLGFRPLAAPVAAPAPTPDDPAQQVTADLSPAQRWWTAFGSPELDALEAEGLRANADLAAARAGLKSAQELYRAQRAATLPSVQLGAAAARSRNSNTFASPLASNASYYTLYSTQLTAGYVVDLFGGQRAQVRLARAQAEAQRCAVDAAYGALTANIAATVVQLASLNAQRDEVEATVSLSQRALDITEQLHAGGEASASDVAAARSVLEQARAALPPILRQQQQAADILAVLLGRQPGAQAPPVVRLDALTLPTRLPGPVPAALVGRRPDIRAARANLDAAAALRGVAVAARLPSLTLAASGGGAATDFARVLAEPNTLWTFGASVSQTVFDAGALRHRQTAADAALEQAKLQYRSVVLGALQATQDLLQALGADSDALASAGRAVEASERIQRIQARQRALGQGGRLAELSAEAALHQARLALIQARTARYADTIGLFQALGGSADPAPAATAAKTGGSGPT